MARHTFKPLLILLFANFVFAQTATSGIPATSPTGATPAPLPDPPPLPPDVKTPDAPPAEDSAGNPVTRTLKRLAPNCINAIFHACWSSTPAKPQPPQTDERKGAASREVGELYFEHGNYRGAESRFREALTYNPSDVKAMFEFAQALEKLNQTGEALQEYQHCADFQSGGAYTERCRKRMERISSTASISRNP